MSLLKVNEVQNYNGSSLTLTASTVSTSAQLNTGGNISVTGSINVSDDSTTRSNLGLGSIATQDSSNVTVTGGTATLGALTVSGSDSGDLVRITQTGSGNALVVEDSANPDSTPFVVDASGNVGIGTSSPSYKLNTVIGAGESNGVGFLNASGQGLNFYTDTTASNADVFMDLGQSGASLIFNQAGSEKMRIDSSGNVVWGNNGSVPADSAAVNAKAIHASDSYILRSHRSVSTATNHVYFFNPNGLCGKIETTGTTTAYVTSSDYRLKENVTDITDGISRVKQLNPYRFNFIADPDRTVDGFIAHEVSDVVPEAISGEKDAVNEDGSINPQGIDQSKLVPLLTAALQESIALIESQQTQIDTLTARIEALEATP